MNLKVRGEREGAVGIEMPKSEATKGDFAKIWQNLGVTAPRPLPPTPAPPSMKMFNFEKPKDLIITVHTIPKAVSCI